MDWAHGYPGLAALERNVVVEIVGVGFLGGSAAGFSAAAAAAARTRGCTGTRARAELDVAAAAPTAFAAAQQLHAVADDLRRVLFDAFLVGVLARLQPALDVNG